MPAGEEHRARAFFVGVLGMEEIAKPAELEKRGGAWFASGFVQLHLGAEEHFVAAKKAHPALRCTDYQDLIERLGQADIQVQENSDIPNQRRAFIDDPFGNRIELLEHNTPAPVEARVMLS